MENKPDEGEIALCTLVAFNLGKLTPEKLPELADIAVRSIDALFDYQDYPVKAAEHAKNRRAIGAGVINLAYFLAKNGVKYSDGSANNLVHELFEAIQYHLLNASAELAGERGACAFFGDTKYAQGLLPIDWYNKRVDDLHTTELKQDWEGLREKIAEYGLRNSTLTALMPSETSSQISNATNGIEPPRKFTTSKSSKSGNYKMVVPEVQDLYENYELAFDMPDNIGYLNLVALMQKFVDQSISANTNYQPSRYPDGKVPTDLIIKEMLHAYRHGVKTMYYHNTDDGFKQGSRAEEDECEGGACKI